MALLIGQLGDNRKLDERRGMMQGYKLQDGLKSWAAAVRTKLLYMGRTPTDLLGHQEVF